MFAALEAKIKQYWANLSGEAKAELEDALDDVKAQEAKFAPLLTAFESDLKAAVAAVEPEVKASVETLLTKLLEDAGSLLGKDLTSPDAPSAG